MLKVINDFRDPAFEFLSNFSISYIEMDGVVYPTVEHAFQAAKTEDLTLREKIRNVETPQQANRIGQFIDLIPSWNENKLNLMKSLLTKKFETVQLRKKLLSTRDAELVSGEDTFWGVVDSVGENHLGKLLMEIRSDIIKDAIDDYRLACRDILLSSGWVRDLDGDVVFDECWTPPWDFNCQFDIFSAVQHQTMEADRIIKTQNSNKIDKVCFA